MEEDINTIYGYPFNELKTTKRYAPVIISILKTIKESKEPISIQGALEILDDSKKILLQTTKV